MLPFQAAPGQFGEEVRQAGLRCWRVEKMKAVPLNTAEVGAFFNGDSYLVLDNRGDQGADLHMWIGESVNFYFIDLWMLYVQMHQDDSFCTCGKNIFLQYAYLYNISF